MATERPRSLLPVVRPRRGTFKSDDEGYTTVFMDSIHHVVLGSCLHHDGSREQLCWTHGGAQLLGSRRRWSLSWVRLLPASTLGKANLLSVTFFITMWYRRAECGFRMAIFFSAATAAGAFGGLLARAIMLMDGTSGLSAWQCK